MTKILSGIEIIDLCLYFRKEKILVIGDVHFGFEESLNKQGILVPRFQFTEVMRKVGEVLDKVKIDTVVFNGDIKHEFGKISDTEWRHSIRLLDLLLKYSKKIIFIKGNHDTILSHIAKKRNVQVVEYYKIEDVYICHGHQIPEDLDFSSAKTIIIGHEHPAVSILRDGRTETFKCFLKGKYGRKNLIVMPSFNFVTEGTDVLREMLLSPFLNRKKIKLYDFEAYVVAEGEIYPFGKLRNIKDIRKEK
ncbi:phosphoesterase [Candidatus Woesearchaeota archaeon]|nr:MAG: phosphoesterase [Candidatus Woesearchaeota archaeon]